MSMHMCMSMCMAMHMDTDMDMCMRSLVNENPKRIFVSSGTGGSSHNESSWDSRLARVEVKRCCFTHVLRGSRDRQQGHLEDEKPILAHARLPPL